MGREKPSALSPRQQEILSLLAEGKTYDEIAKQLRISPNTVRNHIYHKGRLMDKIVGASADGSRSRGKAVIQALLTGLLHHDDIPLTPSLPTRFTKRKKS